MHYPVRFAYIDYINQWWPPSSIANALGIPGYNDKHNYNYIAVAFWGSKTVMDIALIWQNPLHFLSVENPFGSTN